MSCRGYMYSHRKCTQLARNCTIPKQPHQIVFCISRNTVQQRLSLSVAFFAFGQSTEVAFVDLQYIPGTALLGFFEETLVLFEGSAAGLWRVHLRAILVPFSESWLWE